MTDGDQAQFGRELLFDATKLLGRRVYFISHNREREFGIKGPRAKTIVCNRPTIFMGYSYDGRLYLFGDTWGHSNVLVWIDLSDPKSLTRASLRRAIKTAIAASQATITGVALATAPTITT